VQAPARSPRLRHLVVRAAAHRGGGELGTGAYHPRPGWFLIYGFYSGFTEGTEKALVVDLAPPDRRGLAFGIYNAVQGVGALAASVMFGVLWKTFGAPVAFAVGAALAIVAAVLLFTSSVGRTARV
jgi:MFS family permease